MFEGIRCSKRDYKTFALVPLKIPSGSCNPAWKEITQTSNNWFRHDLWKALFFAEETLYSHHPGKYSAEIEYTHLSVAAEVDVTRNRSKSGWHRADAYETVYRESVSGLLHVRYSGSGTSPYWRRFETGPAPDNLRDVELGLSAASNIKVRAHRR